MTLHPTPPLNFRPRSLRLTTACILLASSVAFAQTPAPQAPAPSVTPTPAFDVATIKPKDETQRNWTGVMDTPDGLAGSAANLCGLMQRAYGLATQAQITGGPDWARTEQYDVQAKMSAADAEAMKTLSPSEQKTRRQLMLQALLADRFKLKTHSETKQVPVFDLVTTKDISKLKDVGTDPNKRINKDGTPTGSIRFSKGSSEVMATPMSYFASFLSQPISGAGRPVVDKTGLTSAYDFTLNWSPQWAHSPSAPVSSDPADDPISIFTALKEVGLKLQPSTGPIETIVIDHAERPTPD